MDNENENKNGVPENPPTPPASEEAKVEPPKEGEDDKNKNFTALRDKNKILEEKNADLIKEKEEREKKERDLLGGDTSPDDSEKDKKDKKDTDSTLEKIFKRDVREASAQWSSDNEASTEEWEQMRSTIAFTGEETVSEIKKKMTTVFNAIPEVRKRLDKALVDKGKKQAMQNFQDDEMDIGAGGDVDNSSGETETRLNPQEQKFLKGMRTSKKARQGIKKDGETNEWKEGKEPKREFFQG